MSTVTPSKTSPTRPEASGTVVDAMIFAPTLCDGSTTVADLRRRFHDDHLHAALIVQDGVLVTIVERDDLDDSIPGDLLAAESGRLRGRTVDASASLELVRRWMLASGRRRLAVLDDAGRLAGLLCLKRNGTGFCSDADVRMRAIEHRP
ncbi:MAG: hypothetical protein ACR2LX_01855 [Jatrophihabitans sp.]